MVLKHAERKLEIKTSVITDQNLAKISCLKYLHRFDGNEFEAIRSNSTYDHVYTDLGSYNGNPIAVGGYFNNSNKVEVRTAT